MSSSLGHLCPKRSVRLNTSSVEAFKMTSSGSENSRSYRVCVLEEISKSRMDYWMMLISLTGASIATLAPFLLSLKSSLFHRPIRSAAFRLRKVLKVVNQRSKVIKCLELTPASFRKLTSMKRTFLTSSTPCSFFKIRKMAMKKWKVARTTQKWMIAILIFAVHEHKLTKWVNYLAICDFPYFAVN